jgi:VanZ family protein
MNGTSGSREDRGRSVHLLVRYWLPVLLWMAVIFTLSNQPDLPRHSSQLLDLFLKKLGHVSEYVVLAFLVERAWARGSVRPSSLVIPAVIAMVYAISDEYHQWFVPGRYANPWDILIDGLGTLGGLGLSAWRRSVGSSGRDDDLTEEAILPHGDLAALDEFEHGEERHDDVHPR